jgi:hypothetical protein
VSDETTFLVANYLPLPGWLLLVFLPDAAITRRVVHSGLYPIVLATLYAVLLFGDHPGPQGASFFTLEGVTRIFTTPRTIIACWLHYLVFDLFVGAWIVRDRRRLGLPHLASVPSLVLTLLFGPIGLASWLVVRGILRRTFFLDPDVESAGPAPTSPRKELPS